MTIIAEWSAVSKVYRKVRAVHDVSLHLRAGEVTALVGHNGAGKTTLIKLLVGLIRPSSGEVRVLGRDPAGRAGTEARRALGFLPENVAFHGAMTGRELMAFHAGLKRQPKVRNAELLERVGLTHAAGRRVSTYSKGMRQRLGLAQALIGDPKLLLLDEPTSGLDPASRMEVYAMIDQFRREGATVLVSTHALAEIGPHMDRVAIMHEGKLLAAGSVAELRREAGAVETRLRLQVRPCTTATILEGLPDYVRCLDRSAARLELGLPAGRKMELLRMIAGQEEIEDIEMHAPDLEDLYRYIVRERTLP